jgi:hypothetical protein
MFVNFVNLEIDQSYLVFPRYMHVSQHMCLCFTKKIEMCFPYSFVKSLNLHKVDEILHYFLLLGSHFISTNMIIVVLRSKCMTFPCMSVFIRILIYMGSPYASCLFQFKTRNQFNFIGINFISQEKCRNGKIMCS